MVRWWPRGPWRGTGVPGVLPSYWDSRRSWKSPGNGASPGSVSNTPCPQPQNLGQGEERDPRESSAACRPPRQLVLAVPGLRLLPAINRNLRAYSVFKGRKQKGNLLREGKYRATCLSSPEARKRVESGPCPPQTPRSRRPAPGDPKRIILVGKDLGDQVRPLPYAGTEATIPIHPQPCYIPPHLVQDPSHQVPAPRRCPTGNTKHGWGCHQHPAVPGHG